MLLLEILRNMPELLYVNIFRSPGIDSQPGGPVRQPYLMYRPDRYRLAESIPWNRFLGSLNVYKYRLLTYRDKIFSRQYVIKIWGEKIWN